VLSAADGLKLYVCSQLLIAVNASTILALAFMFSCFNMKPAAATILALSYLFANLVMEGIPFFERFQNFLLPHHFRMWLLIFSQPTPWERIAGSFCILAAVNVTAFLVGSAAFQVRDIKS